MTIDEWWDSLEANQDTLINHWIQAWTKHQVPDFLRAIKDRSYAYTAHNILELAWFQAPDKLGTRSIKGFSVLCNLCSDFPYIKDESSHVDNEE